MTDTVKILGQAIPAAAVLTTLYTVPAATSTTVSTLSACNELASATTIRVSLAVAGAADALSQYVYYDLPLAANDNFSATQGWTLATTDVVRCQSANGAVAFSLFGVQVT